MPARLLVGFAFVLLVSGCGGSPTTPKPTDIGFVKKDDKNYDRDVARPKSDKTFDKDKDGSGTPAKGESARVQEAARMRELLIPQLAEQLMRKDNLSRPDALEKARCLITRVCLNSYPWPEGVNPVAALGMLPLDQLKKATDEVSDLVAQFRSASGYPDPGTKSHLKDTLDGLNRGYDIQQVPLWGEWVYVMRTSRQGTPAAVLDAVKVLRERGRTIEVKAVQRTPQWRKFEEATYFSTETLGGMIALMEFDARGKTLTRNQPMELLKLAAAILDVRQEIPSVLEVGGLVQNPTPGILQRIGALNLKALDAKELEGVARITPQDKGFTVVLSGKKEHTLLIDAAGKVEVK